MVKITGPTNLELRKLIALLRKNKKGLWKRVANDLAKPTRQRRRVNLARINRSSLDGETVIVPGKVLGDGAISKKITIAAFAFSEIAKKKIKNSGSSHVKIEELLSKNPEAK
ncbi:MAG TPA: 50S ribosomal protein L18e, partial [Candidatus Woesearchaeota archaeon]|nr:50S ribosomal protein L18e [Candidatus Woesearchaeota archaeon]